MYCVADDCHRRPLTDRGSPRRTHGNAVTNPRIRVCSTVVLTALPPPLRTRFSLPQPVPDNGMAHLRPTSLTTNIRVHARELDLQPDLLLLRRHPRSLLRGVEQAHGSALAHYVHWTEKLGSPVLINGTWYKRQHRPPLLRSRPASSPPNSLQSSRTVLLPNRLDRAHPSRGASHPSGRRPGSSPCCACKPEALALRA